MASNNTADSLEACALTSPTFYFLFNYFFNLPRIKKAKVY